ncbi:Hypothetical protein NocV09_02001240 [Nannochloropsis oceanica]
MKQLEQSLGVKRRYLSDMRPPFQHFYMRDLITCILRAVLQAALVPVQRILDDILEQIQEEDDEDWMEDEEEYDEGKGLIQVDLPDWKLYFQNFKWRVLVNVARSLGTKTIHYSVLDPLALLCLRPRTVDRLTKDPILSARRKDTRLGRLNASHAMLKTVLYANLTSSLSNLLYDCLLLGYDLLIESYPEFRLGPPGPLLVMPKKKEKKDEKKMMKMKEEEEEEEEEEEGTDGGGKSWREGKRTKGMEGWGEKIVIREERVLFDVDKEDEEKTEDEEGGKEGGEGSGSSSGSGSEGGFLKVPNGMMDVVSVPASPVLLSPREEGGNEGAVEERRGLMDMEGLQTPPVVLSPREGGGCGEGGGGDGGEEGEEQISGSGERGGEGEGREGDEEDRSMMISPRGSSVADEREEGEETEEEEEEEEEVEEEEETETARQERRRREVAARLRNIFLVNGTAYVSSLVLMPLGTFLLPGWGTTVGMILADCVPLVVGL